MFNNNSYNNFSFLFFTLILYTFQQNLKRNMFFDYKMLISVFERVYIKFVSAIFYQVFISRQTIVLQKCEKSFLFHLKSSFRSRDIQIFVFLSSPLFLPVSHCFRDWSKIDLKVCDVISCLNKNLITHFVWYLKKEKRFDNEILSTDRALNKEHFHWKIMQKMWTRGYFQTPF